MKKKLFVFILICSFLVGSLTSCKPKSVDVPELFCKINYAWTDCLYYDTVTGIVYVIFKETDMDSTSGYMSPYYSENGKLYAYDKGQLVEIK